METIKTARFLNSFDQMVQEIKIHQSEDQISIRGNYHFNNNILKANTIVFTDQSSLVLNNLDVSYIAIVAKKMIFSAPGYRGFIQRDEKALIPTAGAGRSVPAGEVPPDYIPQNAPAKVGGAQGHDGYSGGMGGEGHSKYLPQLFIFTDSVEKSTGGPEGFIDLNILYDGIDAGQGGKGGNGGVGGRGQNGGHGVDNVFDCNGGPGNGGRGGPGGKGGKGGKGGRPGNSANLYYLGSEDALSQLTLASVSQEGGHGGRGGLPGEAGTGGPGGARGSRTTHCRGGDGGSGGLPPVPRDNGVGEDLYNSLGDRGVIERIRYDISTLF